MAAYFMVFGWGMPLCLQETLSRLRLIYFNDCKTSICKSWRYLPTWACRMGTVKSAQVHTLTLFSQHWLQAALVSSCVRIALGHQPLCTSCFISSAFSLVSSTWEGLIFSVFLKKISQSPCVCESLGWSAWLCDSLSEVYGQAPAQRCECLLPCGQCAGAEHPRVRGRWPCTVFTG